MFVAYFDGGCQPKNPEGVATYGYVIYLDEKNLARGHGIAGKPYSKQATNSVGEYTAIIKVLEWFVKYDLVREEILIRGDSQFAIRQLYGYDENGMHVFRHENANWKFYKVRAPNIKPLYEKTMNLLSRFSNIKFEHVKREENEEADALSNKAYKEYIKCDRWLGYESDNYPIFFTK